MKKSGKKLMRQELLLNVLIILLLVVGLIGSMASYWQHREYAFYNDARLYLTDELALIREVWGEEEFPALEYEKQRQKLETSQRDIFVLADLKGNVIYSQKEDLKRGSKVSIDEFMQTDRSLFLKDSEKIKLTFAVENEQGVRGFAAFYLPRAQVMGMSNGQLLLHIFMPMGIALFLVVVVLFYRQFYMKRRMIEPVGEMLISSQAIIEGDYTVPVIHARNENVIDNDIDLLAYHFELMRDELSDRVKKEQELKRSQKELISCISHDLKTPIATIQAYGEGMRDGLAGNAEKVGGYAEIIVQKAKLLTKLINDLIEHSNAELNQLSIVKKEQYIGIFLNRAAGELSGLAEHFGIQFFYENQAPNLLVPFDENRIMQVLENLVDNAMKYRCKDNPRIELRVSYEEVKHQICVEVWDNGKGISSGDIPFVFDRFYRAEKSRSSSIPGSGLGLSICKYIVEAHGGTLTCESHREQGTRFTFTMEGLSRVIISN